jgi:chromate reductase
LRLLGIAGSLRVASHNRSLLRAAAEELPPGVEFIAFEDLKAVEPFDETDEPDTGGGMPGADNLIAAVRDADADAILSATPEYNGSIPASGGRRILGDLTAEVDANQTDLPSAGQDTQP